MKRLISILLIAVVFLMSCNNSEKNINKSDDFGPVKVALFILLVSRSRVGSNMDQAMWLRRFSCLLSESSFLIPRVDEHAGRLLYRVWGCISSALWIVFSSWLVSRQSVLFTSCDWILNSLLVGLVKLSRIERVRWYNFWISFQFHFQYI